MRPRCEARLEDGLKAQLDAGPEGVGLAFGTPPIAGVGFDALRVVAVGVDADAGNDAFVGGVFEHD